jgi:hypothetical protein
MPALIAWPADIIIRPPPRYVNITQGSFTGFGIIKGLRPRE